MKLCAHTPRDPNEIDPVTGECMTRCTYCKRLMFWNRATLHWTMRRPKQWTSVAQPTEQRA